MPDPQLQPAHDADDWLRQGWAAEAEDVDIRVATVDVPLTVQELMLIQQCLSLRKQLTTPESGYTLGTNVRCERLWRRLNHIREVAQGFVDA